jgi:hypothetical protein
MSLQPRTRAIFLRATLVSLIWLALVAFTIRAEPQNVTLVSFTAITLPGLPEIYIEWETATELDTVGFFIARSDSVIDPFTRVSHFIPSEGDPIVGAQYYFLDKTTALNQTYYYRLEAINTDQTIDYYGPISATAGVPAVSLIPRMYLPLIARTN